MLTRLNVRRYLARMFNVSFVIIFSSLVVINYAWSVAHYSGATLGKFGVTGSGTAKYAITLQVPPGTKGMSPSLQLIYRSSKRNGSSGVGWSLSGVSKIYRCSQTMVQDGQIKGVDYTATDKFCLDGQRLTAVSGTYGDDQTEYKTEIASYAKIISYGTAGTGPAYFKVWTKSGQIIEYGASTSSRILAQGKTEARVWAISKTSDTSSNYIQYSYFQDNTIGHYRLDRIDYSGNDNTGTMPGASVRMVYETRTDSITGYVAGSKYSMPVRLSKIQTYAGPTLVKEYQLTYEYGAGSGKSRLIKLLECGNNDVCKLSSSFTWTKSVNARFVPSNFTNIPDTYLSGYGGGFTSGVGTRIIDINGDGVSDIIQIFAPQAGRYGNVVQRRVFLGGSTGFVESTSYSSSLPHTYIDIGLRTKAGTRIQDINGDGLPDIIQLFAPTGGGLYGGVPQKKVYLNTGSSFVFNQEYSQSLPDTYFSTNGKGSKDLSRDLGTRLKDINGDGLPDLIQLYGPRNYTTFYSSVAQKRIYLNTGTRFVYSSEYSVSVPSSLVFAGSLYLGTRLKDINGDGLPDLIQIYGQGASYAQSNKVVYLNNGKRFVYNSQYTSSLPNTYFSVGGKKWGTRLADVNGDGLPDIVTIVRTGTPRRKVYINTGTGFVFDSVFTNSLPDTYIAFYDKSVDMGTQLVDVNGDGKQDLIQLFLPSSSWYNYVPQKRVYLSTGTAFVFNAGYSSSLPDTYFTRQSNNDFGTQIVDLNGDGQLDIIQLFVTNSANYGGAHQRRAFLNSASKLDLLVSINNGLGDKITISYKPISDKPTQAYALNSPGSPSLIGGPPILFQLFGQNLKFYTKGTSATYPIVDVQNARYVVSSYSKSDGIGGMYAFNYKYTGAKVHVQGRGFLGFKTIAITDTRAGTITTTTYDQNWPTNGMIVKSEMKSSNGILLESTSNSYQVVDLGLGRKAVHLQTKIVIKNELNGALVTQVTNTNTYDSYGNATSIVVASNDGYSTTTNSLYSNNTSNWIIGRLTNIKVTKTAPGTAAITRESSFSYDLTTGLVTQQVVQPNNATYQLTTSYSYDGFGNKISSTIAGVGVAARTTSTAFDARGQFPVSVRNALGHTTIVNYDPMFGNKLTQTSPNGLTTTWVYDSLGRKTTVTRADGSVTTTSYSLCQVNCNVGQPLNITIQKTGSVPVTFYYDPLGREVKRTTFGFSNQPITRITTYDTFGRVSSVSTYHFDGQNNYKTLYQYDLFGRLIKETKPNNAVTSISYSVLSRTHTNDKGQTVTRIKNSQGWLIKSIDHNGNANTYSHNAYGNLLSVTDAAGNVTSMAYNVRGQKISMNDPNMGRWDYRYNALGQLIWQKNAKNQQITLTYDVLSRMVIRSEPEGTTAWTYDSATKGLGKIARVDSVSGYAKTYAYDNLSRLSTTTTIIKGQPLTQSVTYDSLSRPDTRTYPTGFKIQNVYNAQGFLSEIKNVATKKVYWKALAMNARGQLTQHVLGNNVGTTTAYDDSTGRVYGISSGNGLVQNLMYTFDSIGNLTERKDTKQNINETFTYDNLNRLTSNSVSGSTTSSKTYQYDIIGNITSKTGVGNYLYQKTNAGPNAVTKTTSSTGKVTSYTYDANGNMISGDGRTLTYTSFNKPLTIAKNGATNTYAYDAARQRLLKYSVKSTGSTLTVYLGKTYEQVRQSATNIIEHKHYINANGTTIIYTSRSSKINDTRYLHKDHIGSTDAITNEKGQVVERASFNAWGERRLSNWTGSTATILSLTTRGFTGHEMDDGVGLINMNARMYDAKLGRFLQPDTYVQFPESTQGFNRYTYVENNPLSYTDPTGNSLHGRESDTTSMRGDVERDRPGDGFRDNDSSNSGSESVNSRSPARSSKTNAADIGRESTRYTNKNRQIKPEQGNVKSETSVTDDLTVVTIWHLNGKKGPTNKNKEYSDRVSSFFGKAFSFIGDVTGITAIYESAVNIYNNGGSFGDYVTVGLAIGGGALVGKLYKLYKGRRAATRARDAEVARIRNLSKTQQRKVATVVGAFNKKTGKSGVGVKRTGCDRGKCAEDLAREAVGGNPADVLLTPAVRPRLRPPGDKINVCLRCQGTFRRSQFPRGTKFD